MRHLLIGLILGISLGLCFGALAELNQEPRLGRQINPSYQPLPPMPQYDAPKTYRFQDLKPC